MSQEVGQSCEEGTSVDASGFDTGVTSGALVVIGADLGGVPLSINQESWLVSSALVGACVGSLLAGTLTDRWGKKPIILGAAALFALGALEQAAAQVYREVVLGRIIVGIAVGLASTTIPNYLAELSPAKYRGRIVASTVVAVTGGQVVAYIIGAAFASVQHGWRWMFGLGAVPAVAQLLLAGSVPESPRYQIERERIAPARRTLKKLFPKSTEVQIQRRIEKIQEDIQEEVKNREALGVDGLSNARDSLVAKLWKDSANRKALILACGLQFFQQATGFNTVMYYSGKILQAAHFSKPAAFAVLVAVANFICTIIALRIIDRFGRRPLLLYTLTGMIIGMFFIGLGFLFVPIPSPSDPPGKTFDVGGGAVVTLVAVVCFTCSYALGLGNVPWVVQSEVFSHELRALGTGFSTAITPTGAFWFYGVQAILGWLFTYYFLPETKGLDLEATRALFEGKGWRMGMARSEDVESGRGGYEAVQREETQSPVEGTPGP
ncbi:MFS myo-inositol transporter [Pseudohyphozyma bogoriensis]|nr:MFS myo-inositol transporter [Pseudohyphozyma bogoriensis]